VAQNSDPSPQILVGTRNNFVIDLADFGTQTEKGCPPLDSRLTCTGWQGTPVSVSPALGRLTAKQGKPVVALVRDL